jgi:membrane-associated phospholipid phosphatase
MIPIRALARRFAASALVLSLGLAAAAPVRAAEGRGGQAQAIRVADPDEDGFPKTLKQAGRNFLQDTGRIWSSPARLRKRDIVPVFALAAGAAVLIASDEAIRDGIQSYAARHTWVGDVSPVLTQLGGPAGFAVTGAFFGVGLLFKDDRARDTGYLAASAVLQAVLVDNTLKFLAGRRRPYVADGEDHWGGPAAFFKGDGEDARSFPSGHTAAAFALATVVSLQYRRSGWVPAVAYTLATGVGLSRIGLDRHWASDVFVGAAVGHFIGRLVVRDHTRRKRLLPVVSCSPRGFSISLFYDLGSAGRRVP